jgi:ketosteroid isomerase-like protein
MSTHAAPTFNLDQLRQAVEARDADAQLGMFADDAEVVLVDSEHPPSAPMRFQGRDAIKAFLDDVSSRDMTHEVERMVGDDQTAAYTLACRYTDGTRVLCSAMLELRDGRIARQEGLQAWDT